MKVSVVVPTFNNAKYISRCITSIMNQSYKDIEIIIVNDGSTDNTMDILEIYSKKDDRIVIVDQKNSGTLIARINGIRISKGESILNVDSDDYLELHAVEFLVLKMMKSNADMVIGNHFLHKNGRVSLVQNRIPNDQQTLSSLKSLLLGDLTGYIWGRLLKRKLIDNINIPLKKVYSEDVFINFYIFCNNNDIKLDIVEDGILHYNMHDTNISTSDKPEVVEGFFVEGELVKEIIEKKGLLHHLTEELAAFNCRNWVVYCRRNGKKAIDKQYHQKFYQANYALGKNHLAFYQRIEMYSYAKSMFLGALITRLMKWTYNNFFIYRLIK